MKKMTLILTLLLSIFLIYGCGQKITGNIVKNIEQDTSDVELTKETKEFSITAMQFRFDPSVIEVNKGDKVRLKLKSLDVLHGFALPDFGISESLEPRKTIVIEFIADKTGTFEFYCSIPCGSGHGRMNGKLIVR